ncbi:MAG TPA: hypothetical protein VGI16_09620 [Candidatus Acidoferrum sp.]|jgi:DNA-binding beta-propeller fold protein YncE
MSPRRNFRLYFLSAVLLVAAVTMIAREHSASFLRPGLHLNAYVATSDGALTVVDLVKLSAVAKVQIAPDLSGVREDPTRAEVWGVSPSGGYVWSLNTRSNQITARISVGPLPYSLDFSRNGNLLYTTSAGSDTLMAINCESHSIVGRAATGRGPVVARVTPDGKTVLVINRSDASLGIHDAATLALRAAANVVAQPDDVAVTPDNAVAFVLSRSAARLSVVDLRSGTLLANLQLAGKPSQMLLKPDGGELYVLSPESHGLQVINTWTHEVGDYVLLGFSPTVGALTSDASLLYVADTSPGRVTPVDIGNRRVTRTGNGVETLIPVGQSPAAVRFDPAENLLLVVNQGSGDLSVIRIRSDRPSLLTMIPVGDRPQDLAVKMF